MEGADIPAVVVLGAQWGDEGKGKATDQLGASTDYVVKFNGGNNAGHTVVVGDEKCGRRHRIAGGGLVVEPVFLFHDVFGFRGGLLLRHLYEEAGEG